MGQRLTTFTNVGRRLATFINVRRRLSTLGNIFIYSFSPRVDSLPPTFLKVVSLRHTCWKVDAFVTHLCIASLRTTHPYVPKCLKRVGS